MSLDQNATLNESQKTLKIGWIGCGIMGLPMCCNIIRTRGYQTFVYSRTAEKCSEAVTLGAQWCSSPKEIVLQQVDILICLVGFPKETLDVVFGKEGVVEGLKCLPENVKRPIFIDMSTNDPQVSCDIYASLKVLNVVALDAPVSGGDVGARARRLSVFVGGDEHIFHEVKPLVLEAVSDVDNGGRITYIGGPGEGQRAKIMNQILIASNMIGVCEAILYGQAAGIPVEKTLETISVGAAGSWSLSHLGPRILKKDFAPGFVVDHFVKDLGIALKDSSLHHLKLPGLQLAHSLYLDLQKRGFGQMGTQSLLKELQCRQDQ